MLHTLALARALRLGALALSLTVSASKVCASDASYAPAQVDRPRPVALYLHGVCGRASRGCATFREGTTEHAWMLCPQAPTRCANGGGTWRAPLAVNLRAIRAAEASLAAAHPGAVDVAAPGVIVGFSQGAYLAERVLAAEPGRHRGVAFVAAFVRLTRASLAAAGVRRVVLAAAHNDLTYRHMHALAETLARDGVAVRFVDLGPVGHSYVPAEGSPGWRAALSWLADDAPAPAGT